LALIAADRNRVAIAAKPGRIGCGALNSQTLAALGTPRVDDQTAANGFHTGAKAMGALAAYDGGLKCTFHDGFNSLVKDLPERWLVSSFLVSSLGGRGICR
jgi:hypothetical protein